MIKNLFSRALVLTFLSTIGHHAFAQSDGSQRFDLMPGARDLALGAPMLPGVTTVDSSNAVITVRGGGTDIWGTADSGRYYNVTLNGDTTFITKLSDVTNTHVSAKAGIMFRKTTAANSANVFLAVTGEKSVSFQRRLTPGGLTVTSKITGQLTPMWLRLDRRGETIAGFYSLDGENWKFIGAEKFGTGEMLVGLAVTSHDETKLCDGTFSDPILSVPPELPAPLQNGDVGAVGAVGWATGTADTLSINGAGSDIGGTLDSFHWVYRPVQQDDYLVARVDLPSVFNGKAGLTLRETSAPGACGASILLSRTAISFTRRSVTGGTASSTVKTGNFTSLWLMLDRRPNSIAGYYSTDGATWEALGAASISVSELLGGFAVCSRNTAATAQAEFHQYGFGHSDSNLPEPWISVPVGSPALAGIADYDQGVFTIRGSGVIPLTTDALSLVAQPISGDAILIARTQVQTLADSGSRVGIMIRNDTSSGSAYSAIAVTPVGIQIVAREGQGVNAASATVAPSVPTTAPVWFRLEKWGNRVDAYYATQSEQWIYAGSRFGLGESAVFGMFATAGTGVYSKAAFDFLSFAREEPIRGLTGEYYDNDNHTSLKNVRIDGAVNYSWGASAPVGLTSPDTFSVRWSAYLKPPRNGDYTFTTSGDDQFRLWIDDVLIIDRWVSLPGTYNSAPISLNAGQDYKLRLDYRELSGSATARLLWSEGGAAAEIIPPRVLTPIIDSEAPSAPANLVVDPLSSNSVQLSWNAATDNNRIADYRIFRNGIQIGVTSGLSFIDASRVSGVEYEYYVTAVDAGLNSASSETASLRDVVIVDNGDARVRLEGAWISSVQPSSYFSTNYLHDGNAGKGDKRAIISTDSVSPALYEVFMRWPDNSTGASQAPLHIHHAGGHTELVINYRSGGGTWVSLGSYFLGTPGSRLILENFGANGTVYCDAFAFVPRSPANLDNDLMPDDWERATLGDTAHGDDGDADYDNLSNLDEFRSGTNPNLKDSDKDGLPDNYELANHFNPVDDADGMMVTVRFRSDTLLSYGVGQDDGSNLSSFEILDEGNRLQLSGNNWKAAPAQLPLTDTTTARFEFRSDGVSAEVNAVGFESNAAAVRAERFIQFFGTQSFGTLNPILYSGQGWKTFHIRTPAAAQGVMRFLALANDADAGQMTSIQFRDVVIGADRDGDGLLNREEFEAGSDVAKADTDNDGMGDYYEARAGLDPRNNDTLLDKDNDGVSNIDEFRMGTHPANADSDGDGMPDGFEVRYGFSPLSEVDGRLFRVQFDSEKLRSVTSQDLQPNQFEVFADGAGLKLWGNVWKALELEQELTIAPHTTMHFWFKSFSDEGEIHAVGLSNDLHDSAANRVDLWGTQLSSSLAASEGYPGMGWWEFHLPLFDRVQLRRARYLHFISDSDAGGSNRPLTAFYDVLIGEDRDKDGLFNTEEAEAGSNPTLPDSDRDGIPDGAEVAAGFDPIRFDAFEDFDRDGKTNYTEFVANTSLSMVPDLVDATAPSPPGVPSAGTVSDISIALEWQPASDNNGIAGYEIYRNGHSIARVGDPKFTDTGLLPDSEYEYQIRAFDFSSNVSVGASATVRTLVSAVPSPWLHVDLGLPIVPGSATVRADGVFESTGSGTDASGREDAGHLIYQRISGAFEFSVKVDSILPLSFEAPAGLVVRESLRADAASVSVAARSMSWAITSSRRVAGETALSEQLGDQGKAPAWLKIVRSGSLFRIYLSQDGTNWRLRAEHTVQLPDEVYLGLLTTGRTGYESATALFSNVVISRDRDSDGVSDIEEERIGTSSDRADSDFDGISDYDEIHNLLTNPAAADVSLRNASEVKGSHAIPVIGTWKQDGDTLVTSRARGVVRFSFTAPRPGIYRLVIGARAASAVPAANYRFAIRMQDEHIGFCRIEGVQGASGSASLLTPFLSTGSHSVELALDTPYMAAPFKLEGAKVQEIVGSDLDQNSVPDWADHYLEVHNGADRNVFRSKTSPACVEGKTRYLTMMNGHMHGQPLQLRHGAGARWYADVPVGTSSGNVIQLAFENGGRRETIRVLWEPTDVTEGGEQTIRVGDTLRFTVDGSNAPNNSSVDLWINGVKVNSSRVGDDILHTFQQSGDHAVEAVILRNSGGPNGGAVQEIERHSTLVRVKGGNLGPSPIAWIDRTRTWPCPNLPAGAVVESGRGLLTLETASESARTFSLKIDEPLDQFVIARTHAGGAILDSVKVRGIRIDGASETGCRLIQVFPDGVRLVETTIAPTRVFPDATVQLRVIVAGVLFEDGTGVLTLNPEDFDEFGEARVRFLMSDETDTASCHTVTLQQDGVDISKY